MLSHYLMDATTNTNTTERNVDTNDIARITVTYSDGCLDDVELENERGTDAYEVEASEIMDRYCDSVASIWREWYPAALVTITWGCQRCADLAEFIDGSGDSTSIGFGAGCELEGLVAEATDRAWSAIW